MKTKEELNAIKEEVETLNKKLAELTEDELKQVTGGEKEYDYVTKMVCSCGYYTSWLGHFVHSVFDCPGCGKHTLIGAKSFFIED